MLHGQVIDCLKFHSSGGGLEQMPHSWRGHLISMFSLGDCTCCGKVRATVKRWLPFRSSGPVFYFFTNQLDDFSEVTSNIQISVSRRVGSLSEGSLSFHSA